MLGGCKRDVRSGDRERNPDPASGENVDESCPREKKHERKLSYKKADEREPPGFLPLYFSRGP
jgi:hypothetical protein